MVLLIPEELEAVGEPLRLTRCCDELPASDGDADIISHVQPINLFM